MSLKSKIINKLSYWVSHQKDKLERETYVKSIKDSFDKLPNKEELTKEQIQEIQEFFMPLLGYAVPTEWHKYFSARTGNYSKLYIPTSIYKTDIVGRLNVFQLKRAYTDKNMTDILLPQAKQPKILLKNMNGYFYIDGKPISLEEALAKCSDLGDVMLKPSLSSRGNGVRIIHIGKGITNLKGKSLRQVFEDYISDFQLQELVHQHKDMAALNPTSINTIRVLTYRVDMEIVVLYTVVRIGRKGSEIDNESAGGISTIINSDGTLGKYAYGAPGVDKLEQTDSGIRFEGYIIPSYQETLEKVKQYHLTFPFFKLMAWDIAIDTEGEPMLIEFNMTPDLSQSAFGPAFGEYTETIIKEAMSRNNTWSRMFESGLWKHNDHYTNKFTF